MKVGIVTIIDNGNFGNRLQNYALCEILKKLGVEVETISNFAGEKSQNQFKNMYLRFRCIIHGNELKYKNRHFKEFNRNIRFTKRIITNYNNIDLKYDYFISGSDQVWNPYIWRLGDIDLLTFANQNKRVSYAASIAVSELDKQYEERIKKHITDYKAISVRENNGRQIIQKLTGRNDVEVLIDPTMLLSADDWNKVSNKPKNIKDGEKYILNYFLGKLPEEWDKEIKRIAKDNNCKIINILDEKDPYFISGPSEFLYLEKNAFLVCTDSFHSSVFSIIYDTPFVVFNRKDKYVSMNSRLDTLLSKFKLEDRKFSGNIPDELLKCDYSNAKKILENEREKSRKFICNALDIKE